MNSCPECGSLLEKPRAGAHRSEPVLQLTAQVFRENFGKPRPGEGNPDLQLPNGAMSGMEMNVFETRHRSINAAVALFECSIPPTRVLVLPLGVTREFTAADLGGFAGAGEIAVLRCRELALDDWFIVTKASHACSKVTPS
jgi:hypothetical protein